MQNTPEPRPGEWQEEKDALGVVRRFRQIGSIKEYEPTVTIDGMQIPQSDVEEYHKRKRAAAEAAEKRRAEEIKRRSVELSGDRVCPLKTGVKLLCSREDCALFNNGCVITMLTGNPATIDTAGRDCPITRYAHKCGKSCAFYKNGCALTGIAAKESEDK